MNTIDEGLQGFAGRELEGDLLVFDLLLVFIVNLGDSLFNLVELILEGADFLLGTCQVDFILKLLE